MNHIKKQIEKLERPITWASRKSGIEYYRLRSLTLLPESELLQALTVSEANKLQKIGINIEVTL